MSCTFSHSGDLGDLIYGLPAIRGLGGGSLWLTKGDYTRLRMTPERVPAIAEFVETLPYIEKCIWNPDEKADVHLDSWRRFICKGLNTTQMHLRVVKLPDEAAEKPWIEVEPRKVAKVVISRTLRYTNRAFPWAQVVKTYGSDLVMVGYQEEYEAFTAQFGSVPYLATPTLMDLAQVVAGSVLYVGNQSAILAIASAMGKNIIHEVCPEPRYNNCIFHRKGHIAYEQGVLELPKIEDLES